MGPSCNKYLYFIQITAIFYIGNVYGYTGSFNWGPSNQSEAYFNGSSYVRLTNTISLKKQTSLSFRTCVGGSLFSQQQNDDLIELSVLAKGLLFYAKTAGHQYEEVVAGNFLDNSWHTVYLEYKLGNLTIEIDRKTQLISNGSHNSELLTSPGLYNEGSAVLLIGKKFNGCLLEGPSIVFDPKIIQSFHNVVFGPCPFNDDACTLKEHSDGFDYCLTEPCLKQGLCINGKTSYTCTCSPRYTGKNCEIDLGDPCERQPSLCKNGAVCTSSTSGEYTCTCQEGFSGKHCDQAIRANSLCKTNPCLNGGQCSFKEDINKIVCTCRPGFIGLKCETNVDDCLANPCKNNGKCIDGVNNYTCDCTGTGYSGAKCEVNVNECLTNPCVNHATCFDNYGSYSCQCMPGYAGKNCQVNINECTSLPCFNNGLCIDKPGGYECRCLPGFLGEHCEVEQRSLCDPSSCGPYADCITNNNHLTNVMGCVCKPDHPGLYPNCTVDAICLPNPCRNGGVCSAMDGSFTCSCLPGYTGKLCQMDANECSSMPCQNGGICIDKINEFFCNCTEYWMGTYCEKPFDICELTPCLNNATCITKPNKRDYECHCKQGFEGSNCETNINDCLVAKCPPGKVCYDLVNSYDCRCPPGYSGENCTIDLDPCAQDPCGPGATCTVDKETHGYKCVCPPGYTGPRCDQDIDECKLPVPPVCQYGLCVNLIGSYQCYCKPGYTGQSCDIDIDECLPMPCKNNATCVNQVNNFECICPPGYKEKDCSFNINDCDPMPCTAGSTCIDGVNEYKCVCQPGLTGKQCEVNINDCESNPCQNNAKCIDGLNSYVCNCTDTGYSGTHCETNIDDCIDNPCKNGAECIDEVKDYHCKCYPGYTGKNCEEDINECESNPCKYNGTCIQRSDKSLYQPNSLHLPESYSKVFSYTTAEGYDCLCVKGVVGKNCETNINECDSSPCFQGTCIDKIGEYECECEEGFEGVHCDIDVDECLRYQPCMHGTCIDKKANYYCACEPNYGGKNCSVELMGCVNNPCLNNGNCIPYLIDESEHRFNCTCPNGFHGDMCEQITTMSLSGNTSMVIVNSTRDEGYDIQFRFKTTLTDGLLALGKGFTYYILVLRNGRLNLHSSLLNKWEGVFMGSNLNNSKWHSVSVTINSTHLSLSANFEQTIYPISFNENYNVSSTSFPVTYIGGIPSNLRKLTQNQPYFIGCTEDLMINGERVFPGMKSQHLNFQNVMSGCSRKPQCAPNPCHNGGQCTDMWQDFSCTCERPFLGRTCEYNFTAATFGYENISDSLVSVNVSDYGRRAVRTIVDISMFIKTRQAKGQIFYLGTAPSSPAIADGTYISADLDLGALRVKFQFYNITEFYNVGAVKLDNGYNHLIQVIRNATLIQVKLNGTEHVRKTISVTGSLDAQVLLIGGAPQVRTVRQTDALTPTLKTDLLQPTASAAITSLYSDVNFKGIIQDIQISNGSYNMVVEFYPLEVNDLDIPDPFGIVSFDKSLVMEGIHSDNMCKNKPCAHDGKCFNTWNDYRCECPRGFKGKDCTELEFCEIEKCPQGSTCTNLEDGYECVSNATFSPNSQTLQYGFRSHPNITHSIILDQIQITYRTRSWGTVFFAKAPQGTDYFVIFVYYNEIAIEWSLGNISDYRHFTKDNFQGQWLTLLFTFKANVLKGGFKDSFKDDNPNFEIQDFDSAAFERFLKTGIILVGGSDQSTFDYQKVVDNSDVNTTGYIVTPGLDSTTDNALEPNALENVAEGVDSFYYKVDLDRTTDKFKGCLGEIRIGGLLLPFFTNSEIYSSSHYLKEYFELKPTTNTSADIGCILCSNTDCYNDGKCRSPEQTYKCVCPDGFTADDCSIDINECESNPCQNNATCVDLVAKYRCDCAPGYSGVNCEVDIDECFSNPCRHGGTCKNLIGTFECECPKDYIGRQCEAPLLITCDNKPCQHGSACKNELDEATGNNFTCICAEGMEGTVCDTPFCEKKRCENGQCKTDTPVPFCKCDRGFNGKHCEINIDECSNNPCQHGGRCIDGIDRYDCYCNGTGFQGLICEIDIDECAKNPNACGHGKCLNLPGSYNCTCFEDGKCGYGCLLDDPCKDNPCSNGNCVSQCTNKPDYMCVCSDPNYMGKNCSEERISASIDSNGFNILYVVIPLVLIVFIALAIAMVVLVNIARSKRATRGTYSPSAQEFCNPRVELDHVLKPPPEERLI